MRYLDVLGVICLCTLVGCGGSPKATTITTEPSGAFVSVNGENLGSSPRTHEFDFKRVKVFEVRASMPGFHDASTEITRSAPAIRDGVLRIMLEEDPAWTSTTTSEATNRWLSIPIDPATSEQDIWNVMVHSVTKRYPEFQTLDPSALYMATAPVSRSFRHPRDGNYVIRTTFFARRGSDARVMDAMIRSELIEPSGTVKQHGRVFKEDADIIQELQSRLGVRGGDQ